MVIQCKIEFRNLWEILKIKSLRENFFEKSQQKMNPFPLN